MENRKELEERLIYTMAAILTKEQQDEVIARTFHERMQ